MGDSLSHLDDLLSVVHANQINNIFDWSFSLSCTDECDTPVVLYETK